MSNRLRIIGAAAVLAAITVLVYLPAMRGGFVWDDKEMTVENAVVKSARGLSEIWLGRKLPEYHPLTYSVFWLEWRWWGRNPAGYHVVNILLHAADAVLLWLVLRALRIPGSWVAALLFGVHPVCVGTAAWIAELKNTLSMFFYLAAILFYLRAEEAGEKLDRRFYALALAAFAAGLLSKISVAVLPPALLLIEWWRAGRISRRELARTGPFFLLAAAAGLYGMTLQNRYTGLSESFLTRLLGGSRAVWFYLGKIIWPVGLTIVYPRWPINPGAAAAWIPGAALLALFYIFWRNRAGWGRACLFGFGYFVIALGPVLGVFKMVYLDFSQVADHLQYLAMPGIIALAAAGGATVWRAHLCAGPAGWERSSVHEPPVEQRTSSPLPSPPQACGGEGVEVARFEFKGTIMRLFCGLGISLVALALAVVTWRDEGHYADMGTLWRQNLAVNPDSFNALLYMGAEADREHRYEEAAGYFGKVLRMNPDSVEGNYNMGILLDDEGKVDEAIICMEKTLRLKPDQADAHILMGWFLDEKGREEEAMGHLREAIRLAPNDFRAHQNLGNLLAKAGRLEEAARELGAALKLAPENAGIYAALGFVQGRRGEMAAARACFAKALELEPGNTEAKRGLGSIAATKKGE